MKIRRYLGYDCDSVMGFNNGRYIDDEPIEVASYEEAVRLCQEALTEYLGTTINDDNSEDIAHGDGPCIEVKTGYYDKEGNELTEEEYNSIEDDYGDKSSYRYVYVSAERE